MHKIGKIQDEYRLMYVSFLRAFQRHLSLTQPRVVVVGGFGSGPELPLVANYLPDAQIVAIDRDERAILNARRRFAKKRLAGMSFFHADLQSELVQYTLLNTDLIVGFFVLHLLEDSERVSSDWYDLTPPCAKLVLADWCAPDPCPINERWSVSIASRHLFEMPNPEHVATSAAILRIAVKT